MIQIISLVNEEVRNEGNAELARMIYELRKEAALTQKDLAELIGTTQSVISRLEDSDYDGHSLPMLERIAKALNRRVAVSMREPQVSKDNKVHYAFRRFVQNARRKNGLTIVQASKKLNIDSIDLERMEWDASYRPSPLTLNRLSQFYGLNQEYLAALAGLDKNISNELRGQALKFTKKSDPFAKLSAEEKNALDEFMQFLTNA